MVAYRNRGAAQLVGRMLVENLEKSDLSICDFAQLLGVGYGHISSLLIGRFYFPLILAKPAAQALGIDKGEFVWLVLLQYFPKEAVEDTWTTIGDYVLSAKEKTDRGMDDAAVRENIRRKFKEKKGGKRKRKSKKKKVSKVEKV